MNTDRRKYADRREYNKQAVDKRRKKIKRLAIDYKGGKCAICGYKQYRGALEFHHRDNKDKNFGLSTKGLTRSWKKTKKELDKTILVCSNCHKELHAGIKQLPTETSG
jgi:5-methylcytosine-specific restriction endonuclease McrA